MRFALTCVIITGIVLLCLNIYCSVFSQQLLYESKQRTMTEKAQLLANEFEKLDALTASSITSSINKIRNLSVTSLVITDNGGTVIYSQGSEFAVSQQAAHSLVVTALDGYRVFTCQYTDGVVNSQVAIPFSNYGTISGCIYMMEDDAEFGSLLKMLRNGLLIATLLLELGLLAVSIFYAYQFSRRLRKIMSSIYILQEGNYDHKLRLSGHDELTILGKEFNDLTDRLQVSEGKRRQFVSDASHELKTPLASIKLLSDSILQYDMDMDTVKDFVGDIRNEADRLIRMTEKLLALTKGEIHNASHEIDVVPMAPTLDRVVKMISGIATEKNVTIEMNVVSDSYVKLREDDLYQIAFNLAENGIKYNVPDGKLIISLYRKNEKAVLKVEDTGMGIPPDAIDHVFEHFFRVDKARSRQTGGNGLGLAIVRSIVENNDCKIHLESTLGKGTVFTVEIPRFETIQEER